MASNSVALKFGSSPQMVKFVHRLQNHKKQKFSPRSPGFWILTTWSSGNSYIFEVLYSCSPSQWIFSWLVVLCFSGHIRLVQLFDDLMRIVFHVYRVLKLSFYCMFHTITAIAGCFATIVLLHKLNFSKNKSLLFLKKFFFKYLAFKLFEGRVSPNDWHACGTELSTWY